MLCRSRFLTLSLVGIVSPSKMLCRSRFLIKRSSYFWKISNFTTAKTATSIANDGLLISDSCVQKLKKLCDKNDKFLRLLVESGGCSGFQYKFDLDSKMADDDRIFEKDGVKVVIDETSLEYIKGATIDYHTELIRAAFRVINNPNADLGCSCGASFSIKID